jgi:ABC-type nitrate/sulfonate/bicarbonate transport system substrate-binding protein
MRRALAFSIVLKAALSTSGASAETLKVAVAQRGFWNSSFIEFGIKQGFFKETGLDIDILYTEGGASTLTPVIAGSIDIAMTNGTLGARPRRREPRDSSRNSCFNRRGWGQEGGPSACATIACRP